VSKGTASAPSGSTQFLTVILAVDPEAAERLALAENSGYLRYMVRSGADHTQTLVVPADLASLMIPAPVPAGQIIATEITPTNTKVGDTLDVKITVKNTSDKPLQTMGPRPASPMSRARPTSLSSSPQIPVNGGWLSARKG
jgi:hypothetical protein